MRLYKTLANDRWTWSQSKLEVNVHPTHLCHRASYWDLHKAANKSHKQFQQCVFFDYEIRSKFISLLLCITSWLTNFVFNTVTKCWMTFDIEGRSSIIHTRNYSGLFWRSDRFDSTKNRSNISISCEVKQKWLWMLMRMDTRFVYQWGE